jgi:hypothetical protein
MDSQSQALSGTSLETVRLCNCCQEFKPLSEFYARSPSKLFAQCKLCYRERQGSKNSMDKSDHLYVMTCSVLPGVFKVGRSIDVEARAKELQASQPYYVNVVASFPHQGPIEGGVHADLAYCRVIAPGREWFETPLEDIMQAIGRRIELSQASS